MLTINAKARKRHTTPGDQQGAAVALNPKTGEITAMVSKPSYDPNALASRPAALGSIPKALNGDRRASSAAPSPATYPRLDRGGSADGRNPPSPAEVQPDSVLRA